MPNLKIKIKTALDILESLYHNEKNRAELLAQIRHDEPLDGLVLTILSQNTNDRNRDAAFSSLTRRCSGWAAAAGMKQAELADIIRVAGLSATKSERIIDILKTIKNDFGEYSLKSLRTGKSADYVKGYLGSLPGVGPKTVACVALFDLGLPAFPVDTHIARICKRLGFLPESAKKNVPPEEIAAFMEQNVPEERFLGSHVNMIHHGRALCKARNPLCNDCPLGGECPLSLEQKTHEVW